MYRWYKNAEQCYAHLSDVLWVADENGDWESSRERFRQSAWFTRGWTLQELLAPRTVVFLDGRWGFVGTKADLMEDISSATGIGVVYLEGSTRTFHDACVAMKMSWASKRETSRTEDMAYCLPGLFGINMPLLYGEGEKAFLRLQLEIIKQSDDDSVFAWTSSELTPGVLAPRPRSFRYSGDIHSLVFRSGHRLPYAMTNKGLQFHVPRLSKDQQAILLQPHCSRFISERRVKVRILLLRRDGVWRWARCDTLLQSDQRLDPGAQRIIYIQHVLPQYYEESRKSMSEFNSRDRAGLP